MGLRNYSNTTPVVTLTAGVNDTDTTIYLSNGSDVFPSAPFTMLLDYGTVNEEVVEVTSKTAYNEFVVTRGADSSVAVAHSSGTEAVHGVSARDFDEPNAHIANTSNPHAVTAAQAGAVALTAVGAASGVASLDSSGSVPVSQLGNALTSSIALGLQQFAADGSVLANLPAQVPSAERLLKQAVWWIDAAHSSASGQSVSNLGWGGTALNAQAGSTTGADSNDPKYLDWSGENYVYLPGVAGNYLSVPDEAALDITGDIDIRVRVAMDDWTPATQTTLISKASSGGQFSFQWDVRTNGEMRLYWSTDGSTTTSEESDAVPGFSDGEVKWLRVTMDVDNGAGGYEVKFYTSDDGSTWSQSGATDTGGSTTSIYSGSARVIVGGVSTVGSLSGMVYRAQILDGIDGTPVLDVDCSQITSGSATTFGALTGQTVTINRSTSGRKAVAVTHPCWLFGTDDYMQVADNALLDPGLDSFTMLIAARQWGTPVSYAGYIGKSTASTGAAPYVLLQTNGTTHSVRARFHDGTTEVTQTVSATAGALFVGSAVIDRGSETLTTYVNDTASATASTVSVGSVDTTGPVVVGSIRQGGSFQDFELVAAAIFRRALTSDEISTLNAYFQGRAV